MLQPYRHEAETALWGPCRLRLMRMLLTALVIMVLARLATRVVIVAGVLTALVIVTIIEHRTLAELSHTAVAIVGAIVGART
jgi:hypothetical protein